PPPGPPPEFAAVNYTGWNPPDGGLSVGPSHVLVAVNESYSVFTRSGARLKGPVSLPGLFETTDSTFDPRAVYDAYTLARGGLDHFVVLASAGGYLTLATSASGDPTATWCAYQLTVDRSGATWADYPSLGMDGDYLYITTNQFTNGDNSFQYAELQVIPKASVYASGTANCPTATPSVVWPIQNPGGGNSFTVQPATQPDARPGSSAPMYLVNAIWPTGSNLALRIITPNGAAPPIVGTPSWVASGYIAPYDLPADTPQPRGSTIDTGDTRLPAAVFRYGKLYTANTTMHVSGIAGATPDPYANAQWYEVTPNSLTDSVGISHAITSSSVAYFFPNLLPGCASANCTSPTVVVEVSGSGRNQAASAFVARGTKLTNFASGVGGYTLNSRWGDYPGVAADPAATGPVWVLGEYAQAGGAWGTAVTSIAP
ncbi:MAG: hypothetical protein J2P17_36080, partial [Mycobacterium sp.]|nr:hypothetical protein [Mycobacterium sp.]